MGSFSNRESVLLGCSPQKTFPNHQISFPKNQCGNSDVDFKDVFGGPPRRASIQETRCSFAEDTDSYLLKSEDEKIAIHRRWSGLNEKPVFGDECGSRSWCPADFFDDIFKGSELLMSSSPRKHSQDPFSSSPGSRVLSPVWPLPPRADPLLSSLVPSQFSLPAKLINGTESPTFGSSTPYHNKNNDGALNGFSSYSCSTLSRFSSQTSPPLELTNNDCQQRSLLDEPPLSCRESPNLNKIDETERGSNVKRDSKVAFPAHGSQFHFSIYKWATKGIPLAMPFRKGNSSRWKEKFKFERCASTDGRCERVVGESPAATPQDIASPLFRTGISSNAESLGTELDKQENGSLIDSSTTDKLELLQTTEEAILPKTEQEATVRDDDCNTMLHNSIEEKKLQSVPDMDKSGKMDNETSADMKEAPTTKLKPLRSLFLDTDTEQGFDEGTTKDEYKEGKVKSIKKSSAVFDVSDIQKKEHRKANVSSGKETDKANLLQHNFEKNRAEGKVKEFVKIFNQEASNKTKLDADSRGQNSRHKDGGLFGRGNDVTVTTNKINDRMNFPNMNKKYTAHASAKLEEIYKQSEQETSETITGNYKPVKASTGLKNSSASTPDGSEALAGDMDDTFFLIKELHLREDNLTQTVDTHEELHMIDVKIRKWSNGKERNIRSLLSTLQYVLWSESVWKPVPLVDLIEGNAVKRSYQKALLCLHPDKLQQKGATAYQRYTAEKVFDILQEAWTHFNSLGSF